ncbi:MAG: hypothetical protein WCG20_04120 [bacterium]
MNKQLLTIAYRIVIIAGILIGGFTLTQAFDVPLNAAPHNGAVRGQSKQGALTVGSATLGTGQLTVKGATGLRIDKANCAVAPFTGSNAWPCPISSGWNNGPELRSLQLAYTYKMVAGTTVGTQPFAGTMLDVYGDIKGDATSMNYAGGAFYQTTTDRKPLCALPDGQIAVCGTTGSCGSANGVGTTPAPTQNLCALGTASAVTGTFANWNWTCAVGSNAPVSCSAPKQNIYQGGSGINGNVFNGGVVPLGGNQTTTTAPIGGTPNGG